MPSPLSSLIDRIAARTFAAMPHASRRRLADTVGRAFEDITYRRLYDRGFRPGGIIDIGAYEGNWTRLARDVFGQTPTLMIEAQVGKMPILERVVATLPHSKLAIAALSDRAGETLTFYEMETGSSLLPEQSNAARTTTQVVTQTLDAVAKGWQPEAQNLLVKIDVQGAELKVLGGAADTLARTEVIQLELALLEYNAGAPLMPEVLAKMAAIGFLPIEVSGFSRPRAELVQIDMLFARRDSPLRPTSFTF